MQENKRYRVQYRVAYLKSLLQLCDNCDPRCLHAVVTGDETWLHCYKLRRKTQDKVVVAQRQKPASNSEKKLISEEGAVNDILRLKQNCAAKYHVKRERASLGNTTESLCLLRSTAFIIEFVESRFTEKGSTLVNYGS